MQPTSNFLTQNEKDILKARHRQERDKRLCDRIKSILLLNKEWSYEPQFWVFYLVTSSKLSLSDILIRGFLGCLI